MKRFLGFWLAGLAAFIGTVEAGPAQLEAIIHSQPLHAGRIDPKLFGNFVELLDDVVPGMWAELLNDRSFEGVEPAATWSYYDGSLDICDRTWGTNSSWTIDPRNPFNGARSAKLSAGKKPASLTQGGLGLKKGMTYSFSGYLRAEGAVKAAVHLKVLLPTGEWMILGSATLPRLSGEWRKYAVQLVSRGQTDAAVFELRIEGAGNVWADKLSLMPQDNVRGWRSDVVEAIREVRPAIIRWGGSSVDPGRYRWKQGIGNRDLRTPWRNQNWGRIDPNDVGVDEFCQFCELVGAEPLVCVSFSDGPESAGQLVEYCNGDSTSRWGAQRAANGHAAPYQVKYWQVGNEISGDDPQYLEQIPNFIAAMKRASPGISALTSFPSQGLLDRVGTEIACVCPHHYTTDLVECDHDLERITRMIERTPGCGHVQIGVTEWNIDAGSWGLGRGKQQTLWAALMNARYLHVLMRHSDKVKLACRSNLANSYCGAIIETGISGSGVLKRASFYTMELYAHHARPIPLRLEASNDLLDLFACGSEDRKSAVIFAVNLKPEPVELVLKTDGFEPALRPAAAFVVRDTQNAGQPDVMNHWKTPERIKIMKQPLAGDRLSLPGLSASAIEYIAR